MAITSVTFQYPVAKVADSPWNTIINGMNYTKTNLAPVPQEKLNLTILPTVWLYHSQPTVQFQ